jgi:tetratricopeptide (TPR) repeat protein
MSRRIVHVVMLLCIAILAVDCSGKRAIIHRMSQKELDEHWERGMTAFKRDSYQEGIREFTLCIEHNPRDYGAWEWRAFCYLGTKEYRKAIDDLTRVMSLRPKDNNAPGLRALAYCLAGDTRRSIAEYTRLMASGDRAAAYFLGRGRAYHQAGKISEARRDYERALKVGSAYGGSQEARRLLKRLDKGLGPGPFELPSPGSGAHKGK